MKDKWILRTISLTLLSLLILPNTVGARAQDVQEGDSLQTKVAPAISTQEIYRFPYNDGVTVSVSQAYSDEHLAIDLVGVSGNNHKQIIAASGGWAREVVDDTECDNYILIQHPNGEWIHYSHIERDSALVSEGSFVNEGTVIAEEGAANDACVGQAAISLEKSSDELDSAHLHFAVTMGRDGEPLEPRFCNVAGGIVQSGAEYVVAPCDRTPPSISFNIPDQNRWYNTDQTLSWLVQDLESGVDYFKWEWNDNTPDNRVDSDRGSTTLSAAGEGKHVLYVQAWDNAGNYTIVKSKGWFGYDISAPEVFVTIGPSGWITHNQVTFSWNGSDNLTPNADLRFSYRIVGVTNWSSLTADTSQTFSNIPDGQHQLEVLVYDLAGNKSTVAYQSFGVDTRPPSNPTWVNSGCSAPNNVWQNICDAPIFTWIAADDYGGVGFKDYQVYWGDNPSGIPSQLVSFPVYDPPPIPDGSVYYFRISARDELNQKSPPKTLFILRYDATPPKVTLEIENDASIVDQITLRLNLEASDGASGLDQMRFSNNGTTWSFWQTYASTAQWALPTLNGQELPVYVQVKDKTGNIAQALDTVTLDLYPLLPASRNYRICSQAMNTAGGVLAGTGYSMVSSVGDAWVGSVGSDALNHDSGSLGAWGDCWMPPTDTISYTLDSSVVASGGRLRDSSNYRSGDTIGLPWASGAQAMTGVQFTLSAGFWTGGDKDPLPAPPDPATQPVPVATPTPVPLPAPTPIPTPSPSIFQVSINDGMLFTNKRTVTLTIQGPGVTHMQISNDSMFQGALWETYQSTRSWMIDTYSTVAATRYVYVRFRDAQGTVYDDFVDDIIYDPVAPKGYGTLWETVFTLWAWDSVSGVSVVRHATSKEALAATAWQPYTGTITLDSTIVGPEIYVQFGDQAGNFSRVYSVKEVYQLYLPTIIR